MHEAAKAIGNTVRDREISEIEDRLNRADNSLSRLSHHVDRLCERLRPVMRATGTGLSGAAAGSPDEALSVVGDSIRSIEQRIDTACDRLESLAADLAV